jgi:hypothetical protein
MPTASPLFKTVISKLVDNRLSFEVGNTDDVEADNPLRQYLPDDETDVMYLQVELDNCKWIVYDYDTATLIQLFDVIKSL